MIDTTPRYLAEALLKYGEGQTAAWVPSCSDDEYLRIASVSHWLVLNGPRTTNGGRMPIDKALATAAVYVKEGKPRELARKRRQKLDPTACSAVPDSRVGWDPRLDFPSGHFRHYGVGEDARAYWEYHRVHPTQ